MEYSPAVKHIYFECTHTPPKAREHMVRESTLRDVYEQKALFPACFGVGHAAIGELKDATPVVLNHGLGWATSQPRGPVQQMCCCCCAAAAAAGAVAVPASRGSVCLSVCVFCLRTAHRNSLSVSSKNQNQNRALTGRRHKNKIQGLA